MSCLKMISKFTISADYRYNISRLIEDALPQYNEKSLSAINEFAGLICSYR